MLSSLKEKGQGLLEYFLILFLVATVVVLVLIYVAPILERIFKFN